MRASEQISLTFDSFIYYNSSKYSSCRTRFKKHVTEMRFKKSKEKYTPYILQYKHEYVKIKNEKETIKVAQKSRHIDALEKLTFVKQVKTKPYLMNNMSRLPMSSSI